MGCVSTTNFLQLFFHNNKFLINIFYFFLCVFDQYFFSVLLLNPAKGLKGETKTKLQGHPCQRLIDILGDGGLKLYRDIFSNNNRKLVAEFFGDPIIRSLWEFVKPRLTYKMCFKKETPNQSIILTYQQITKTLET